ncbi:heterokaryon incompatibility protein-domain-containing protein [Xylariaceae sp. FL0804]|nr:heterokaryon incompatibility protein-domain-containing protein [Xylariaceae sp. FL0804]
MTTEIDQEHTQPRLDVDAETTEQSSYQTLVQVPHVREFRLIKLHDDHSNVLSCELRQYKIHQAPPFLALSYTWKGPFDSTEWAAAPTENIMVDGRPTAVGKNLAMALKALRDWHADHDDFIWADAICIDQANFNERAYQVSIMGDIFGSAKSVFVWLGEEAQDSDKALNFVRLLSNFHRDLEGGRTKTVTVANDPRYKTHWAALAALWKRRWWGRAWILQETVLARRANFCCGRTVISDVDVFNHARALAAVWDEVYAAVATVQGEDMNMATYHNLGGMDRLRSARMRGIIFPIMACHYRTMSTQVTDPRDAIFSKLGMASDGYIVNPSYTEPVPKVYTDLVLNHIRATRTLEMIHLDARPRAVPGLPTWVPDFTAKFAANPLQPDHRGNPKSDFALYSASLDRSAAPPVDVEEEEEQEGGAPTPGPTPAPPRKVLCCGGYPLDTVDGVARSEERSWAGVEPARAAAPPRRPSGARCAYGSDADVFEALWRAVLGNQTLGLETPSPETGLVLAREWIGSIGGGGGGGGAGVGRRRSRFDEYCAAMTGFEVFGRTVGARMGAAAAAAGGAAPVHFAANERLDVQGAVAKAMKFRRLLTTAGAGYAGVGPCDTEPGDVVAVLLGCSVPLLLRPAARGGHTVVGEVYLHGVMHGEAMHGLVSRYPKPHVFRLV